MLEISALIKQVQSTKINDAIKHTAISCLDLTSLNDTDTEDNIRTLCQKAITPMGNVAAICLYPQFVDFAKRELADKSINIATVANFPGGDQSPEQVLADIKNDLFNGANEIDIVLPYKQYLSGKQSAAIDLIKAAKDICGDTTLKVILETGALQDQTLIATASKACLQAGADFLKTSTGKIAVGATLESAATMLQAIREYQKTNQRTIGFKASGGVRTAQDAANYIVLANAIMGDNWVSANTFRIGASSLLNDLLDHVNVAVG